MGESEDLPVAKKTKLAFGKKGALNWGNPVYCIFTFPLRHCNHDRPIVLHIAVVLRFGYPSGSGYRFHRRKALDDGISW
jgi:hypothetical protein